MKKLLCLLLCAVTVSAFGQGKTLYRVNVLKPKPGMKSAFEASWKTHMAKYHNATDKRTVYEITSGPQSGSYVIVEGPISYADMDVEKPMTKEHGLDLEKTFSPLLEPNSSNAIYRHADTLSYHGDTKASLFLLNMTVLKDGKTAEFLTEVRRGVLISTKLNSPFSNNYFIKQFAGSSPTMVSVRILKDGYKELDADYNKMMAPDAFKNAYIADYGQDAWDKRVKLQVDDVVSREQQFEKLRTDLSSPQ